MGLVNNFDDLAFLTFASNEFMVEFDSLSLNTEFRNLPSWSSLNALIFISAINDKYGVLISSTDLSNSKNLGDIFTIIQKPN